MSDLKAERYVTALWKCGTIKAAAESLYLSPPALSMYIKKLEEELGVPLFVRSRNALVPTEIGKAYIRRSQEILEIDQAFQDKLTAWQRKKQGQLGIGIYRRRGISFMVPLAHALQQCLPELEISFRIGSGQELETLLKEGQIDFILVTHLSRNPLYQYTHVCHDRLMVACPAAWADRYVKTGQRPYIPLETLPQSTLLIPNANQSIYQFISQLLDEIGIDMSAASSIANMEIAMQIVSAELGCGFTLMSYIPTFSHIPSVRFYSPREKEYLVSWSLASIEHPLDSKRLTVLKDTIQKQIAYMMQSGTKDHLSEQQPTRTNS